MLTGMSEARDSSDAQKLTLQASRSRETLPHHHWLDCDRSDNSHPRQMRALHDVEGKVFRC
eukprot:3695623-Rhodomonas_salina.4